MSTGGADDRPGSAFFPGLSTSRNLSATAMAFESSGNHAAFDSLAARAVTRLLLVRSSASSASPSRDPSGPENVAQ